MWPLKLCEKKSKSLAGYSGHAQSGLKVSFHPISLDSSAQTQLHPTQSVQLF